LTLDSIKAHEHDITAMQLIEAQDTLVTASKDKNMKVSPNSL
jgi:hypothetical protein